MKFRNFFLFLWVIFALLDPDLDSESGFTAMIESLPLLFLIYRIDNGFRGIFAKTAYVYYVHVRILNVTLVPQFGH